MVLRTFLLISDDPDDQLEFSEALYEISSDIVVINISHPQKAMDLLAKKVHVPNYIILDLAIDGITPDVFLTTLQNDPELQNVPVIAYGAYADFDNVKADGISAFIDRDFTYSDLRTFLTKIVAR